MIHYKGHTISAEFAGVGRPAEHVVRRISASGTEGVALLGTYPSVEAARAAIDAICATCRGTGTAGGHRCTQLECCGPCEACNGTGVAEHWLEKIEALKPGDPCEFHYPARSQWIPGVVVENGGSGFWSVRDESDTESRRGQVTTSLYIEMIRLPGQTEAWSR